MIEYWKFMSRSDLQENPHKLFVFGDNLLQVGLGGQAKEMRGEPNAIGIPTKRKPTMEEDAFFEGSILSIAEWQKAVAPTFLELIFFQGIIAWPLHGIGTGRAELKTRAPGIFLLIKRMEDILAHTPQRF